MMSREEALIKIRILINKFYEELGRSGKIYDFEDRLLDLIDEIDEILNKVKLNKKKLILERFKQNGETKK